MNYCNALSTLEKEFKKEMSKKFQLGIGNHGLCQNNLLYKV